VLPLLLLRHPMTKKLPVSMPPKTKEKQKSDRSKRTDKGAAHTAAEEVTALQHENASAAAKAGRPSKPAPPSPTSPASTSSTATERQRVMEANKKEAEEPIKFGAWRRKTEN
jgi:hypothetical protein